MCQTVDIPTVLTVEHGAIKRLHETEVSEWLIDRKIIVISGSGETRNVTDDILHEISRGAKDVHTLTCCDNRLETINRLERHALELSADWIIGIGGGKVLDVSKVVGTRSNIPVILIPTAISNDAICSPVAVITMNKKASIGVKMPQAVIIDLDIVTSCPKRLVRAGIGDLLSNKTALYDWELAAKVNKDTMNTFARLMANNAIEAFMNTVRNGFDTSSELIKTLAESLVMSGIAMSIAGSSRPCSGSEHLISHALDYYCGAKALHGEQVALGILIAEYLQGQHEARDNMRQYFTMLGLPTHYRQLGYTREEMKLAIRKAPTMRDRYTILDECNLSERQIEQLLADVFPERENQRIASFA